jgi:3-dehydroquinate synthase
MHSSPIFTDDINQALKNVIDLIKPSSVVLICDKNTNKHCLPLLDKSLYNNVITVASGEVSKSLDTYKQICSELITNSLDKKGLLISLGGGVISDLTGFVASTYKRGIEYINIPTTLLAMVDAAIGGKTAINTDGIKNCIGTIHFPSTVISSHQFLLTLPQEEILSGYGEVIKHCLIAGIKLPVVGAKITNNDLLKWSNVKFNIVTKDPFEENERYILNAGHTIGHALESFALENKNVLKHGHAIAIGLLIESFLANKILEEPVLKVLNKEEVLKSFGKYIFDRKDIPLILDKMNNDKKNIKSEIQFSFITANNQLCLSSAKKEEIEEALNTYLTW